METQVNQTEALKAKWEVVIGLEVHAQLRTATKLFCRCSIQFGESANSNVCPVCLAYPGALPVLNNQAVKMAARVGLALDGKIQTTSYFERKNYFYPDLPKAYQISQLKQPISTGGTLKIHVKDQHGAELSSKSVRIERIQLEEDAGKLIHSQDSAVAESYVDLNRTSTPLIEIVSMPDMRNVAEAVEYLRSLRTLLRYLEVSDGNMQEGSLRCDANISIRERGTEALGTRTEIKNMNTFKGIEAALQYEIGRQIQVRERGEAVRQETLLFDNVVKKTRTMRSKEEARDYRYFPDPDLLPVFIAPEALAKIKVELPEHPEQKRERFMKDYGLSSYDSSLLVEDLALAKYYERAVAAAPAGEAKRVANWITTEVLSILNEELIEITDFAVSAERLGELVALIHAGAISGKIAKEVFKEMLTLGASSEGSPKAIVANRGYKVVSDESELTGIIEKVLSEHSNAAEQYRGGKKQSFGFLVGQVMRATRGQADPKRVDALLKAKLDG